ncbi:MAG: glycosyltransferase family 4 protein [Bacteroidota bacterium]
MNSHIVVNATNLGRYIGGIGVYALNLLKELPQLDSDHHFIIYINRSCAVHVNEIPFPDNCELRWVSSVVSPDHGFMGHLLRLLYSNYLGLKHRSSLVFAASQLEAILFRRNQIIMVHDIIPLLFRTLHKKQYYYFKYVLSHVLHKTRWIITPSNHTKELLVQTYGINESKVGVIHNGVRDSLFEKGQGRQEKSDGNFILFSGRMVPMKNLVGVLKAFSLIQEKISHRIVITGHDGGRLLKRISKTSTDGYSPVTARVEFKGHVSAKEMDDLMNHASVLVFPSFYEGFGLPPLEGMAHGCPVVVSNVSSLPEVCGDAAEYVDPCNVQSIAEGMYRVLTNSAVRKHLIEKGLERSKLFSWKDSARQHLRLFDQAIYSSGPKTQIHRIQSEGFAEIPLSIGAHRFYRMESGSPQRGISRPPNMDFGLPKAKRIVC